MSLGTAAARPLRELTLTDSRVVFVDDTGTPGPTVIWHAGSPHTGTLHEPLLGLAAQRGIRLVEVTRPGYRGATPLPGRSIADAAADVLEVADLLGLDRFAALGSSGGGPHALACAALAPDRITAVTTFASPAPFEDSPAWWKGMADDRALRAATRGRAARLAHDDAHESGQDPFVDTDYVALDGAWSPLGEEAGRAFRSGGVGLPDDDIAITRLWGVDLDAIVAPVLLVQGRRDRMIPPAHAELLSAAIPAAQLRWIEDAGHVAVLTAVPETLDWMVTS